MRNFTKGQFALGGFGFLLIWILIMSQDFVGQYSGFAVLLGSWQGYDDAKPPLILVSFVLIGLSIFCFYKALKGDRN